MRMVWTAIREWNQKRKLREMLKDRRSARGVRSIGQLEKGIGADRPTTERLLLAVGARKFGGSTKAVFAFWPAQRPASIIFLSACSEIGASFATSSRTDTSCRPMVGWFMDSMALEWPNARNLARLRSSLCRR